MKRVFLVIILLGVCNINYSQNPCPGTPTVTYGNKIYHTVQIGDQCWLMENIDVGTRIDGLKDQTNNGIIEKYCYDNDPANCEIYGGLYTWDEAMKYSSSGEKVQGLCPAGWRLPNLAELTALKSFAKNDGSVLKDVTQGVGASRGSNSSGFSALLAGTRGAVRGNGSPYSHLRVYAFYWSSIQYDPFYANVMELDYSNNEILLYANGKTAAFSLRCLKGEGTTDISENSDLKDIPAEFSLSQNYPNPFNPSTKIQYTLNRPSNILIKVFDITGREITSVVNEYKAPGTYTVDFDGSKLSSGTYYYRLTADDFVQTRKFIVVK